MNILDTFYILFKGDTSNLEKGQKTAMKSTSDLQEKIKTTNADSLDLGASFLDLAQKAASAISVVVGLGAAVKSVFSAEQNAQTIGLFSQTTGEAVGNIDALSQANMRFGGSVQQTLGTLKSLKEGLTFLTPYGGVGDATPLPTQLALTARQYGISVKPGMTVDQFLNQVHNKFKGRDPARNLKIGQALNLDEATIRNVQQTDDAYYKLKNSVAALGTQTQADSDKIAKFNQQWAEFSQQVGVFERAIGGPIVSFLTELLKDLKQIGEAVAIAAAGFGTLYVILAAFGITTLIAPIAALAAAFFTLALGIIAATWPFLLFAAAVAGIFALIHYFPEILKSLGNLFDDVFGKKIKKTIDDVVYAVKELFGWIGKVAEGIEKFSLWKSGTGGEGQAMRDRYNQEEMILRAHRALSGASSSPFSSSSGAVTNNKSSAVHIEKLEVHTQATDAEGIASAIGGSLNKQMNYAINNFNSSVLA